MESILITNGRVIDPANKIDSIMNVFVENGRITSVGNKKPNADKVIDAKGMYVTPGLVDMHVHLREPGNEDEETIASGSAAAISGGFTSLAAMPNTEPSVDNEASAEFVYLQAKRTGKANIYPIGAITKGRKGIELSEMGQLVRGGAVGFSDDGDPVQNANIMLRGLTYSKMFGKTVIAHCEDKTLSGNGVMNSGHTAMTLGLSGMPGISEEITVHRDITLAKVANAKLHIAHISTAGSVELVRTARKKGINVTCEATPHHLTLTDECLKSFDTTFKMNPPLRTKSDMEALREGLKDGTIDVIASDHAPHSSEKKDMEFNAAPFGIIGIETILPIVITELVNKGIITISQAVEKLTVNPARILGIPKGTLSPGADADITIIDPSCQWVIDPGKFKSKSRNCPFAGWKVTGRAIKVIVGGKVFENT